MLFPTDFKMKCIFCEIYDNVVNNEKSMFAFTKVKAALYLLAEFTECVATLMSSSMRTSTASSYPEHHNKPAW